MRMRLGPIALTLTFLTFLAPYLISRAAAQQTDDHFERTFNLRSGGTLVVDNHKGLIRITGSDDEKVVVNVDKKFEGSEKDRSWWMSNTHVQFDNSAERVEVMVEYPNCDGCGTDSREHEDYQASVELTIQVPRNVNLELKGHKPVMNISGINGDIAISSHKSPIEIQSTTGAIRIETYKETVALKDVTIHGTLDVQMAKGEASINARQLGDRVNLETQKGNIVLRVPSTTAMTLAYSGGRRSSFHSDFNIAAEGRLGTSVRGTINGGGTQISARSEKGSIALEKLQE